MNRPRDALHIIAYDRAYIRPHALRQDAQSPPLPPGQRRIARGKQILALAIVTRPRLGQPLLCAGIARAAWSKKRYQIFEREMVPGKDLGVANLGVLRGARVRLFHDALDFSRRRLIAGGYEAGMMPTGWDLPFILSRFARDMRFGRDTASRHMTLDLTGSPWDPRLQVTAWDGTRSRIKWTRFAGSRGREQDGHDVFPGLFFDLQQQAHMYSPERVTLPEACTLFGVVPATDLAPADKIDNETVRRLHDTLRAIVDLASAIVAEWNRIGGAAAPVPSRYAHAH